MTPEEVGLLRAMYERLDYSTMAVIHRADLVESTGVPDELIAGLIEKGYLFQTAQALLLLTAKGIKAITSNDTPGPSPNSDGRAGGQ